MNIPVVKVTVDDARAYGRATNPGYGCDLPFITGGYSPWSLLEGNCEIIPSLQAIGPRGLAKRIDMLDSRWTVAAGQWDFKAKPAGKPVTAYAHMYSGAVGAVGRIVSVDDFPPCWCAWVYRYVPPTGSVLNCDFSIKMRGKGLGYPSWRLVVPSQSTAGKWPYLNRDPFSNGKALEVAYLEEDTTSGMDSGWQQYIIWCELTLNQWILAVSINGRPASQAWVYTPPGTDVGNPFLLDSVGNPTPICDNGKLEIQTQGQQIMVAVAPITYPVYSEAHLKQFWPLDTRLGNVATATADGVVVTPAGTDASVTLDTAASNSLGPRVELYSDTHVRPVCGVVSIQLPATIGDVTTAPWVSTGNLLKGGIHYTRRCTWKGNDLRATLYDLDGSLAWIGNNVVTLEVGTQTTGGVTPTLRKLMTCYLRGPIRDRNGEALVANIRKGGTDYPLPLEVQIEAADFAGSRMKRKDMIFHQSYGGTEFPVAFKTIGNRLGFSDSRITVDASYDGVYLHTPQIIGEPALVWGAGDRPEEALDTMCAEVYARWGLDVEGKLFAKPAPIYGGTPDFVLDSSTTDETKEIRAFQSRRDMEEFVNEVYTLTGPEGYRQIGWARNLLSEDTPGNADFVGDNLQLVERLERTCADAQSLAAVTLGKRTMFQDVLSWRPAQSVAVDPGMFCTTRLANSQVVYDAVYFVVEENGDIDIDEPNALGWQQEFRMVRVS